jgi:hypothetical protein
MFGSGGRPLVGAGRSHLGVVTPSERPIDSDPGWAPDVTPDANGQVEPLRGGMSVAPTLENLPPHRIPRRLRVRGVTIARGSDRLSVWSHGSGPFEAGPVADGLVLRPDSIAHGLVEPARPMSVAELQGHLGATAASWVIDEP